MLFLSNKHQCFLQWIELALSSNYNKTLAFYNSSNFPGLWLDCNIEKEPNGRKTEGSSRARRRMEVTGQPSPAGRVCAHCSTRLASSLLLTCTDQGQSLGALPGTLQLEPHICKPSMCVHACRCTEIIGKLQFFLILIFYSGSTSEEAATAFQIITYQTKPSVEVDLCLWLCFKIMNWKAFVPTSVNFWLFKLFWTYCCCPWFPENVINCSKKKKRGISQEKYKHSAKICCGLFPQWSQRKLGFHPSDLFQGKNVPNPYNYILVSAFKKVKKKKKKEVTIPFPFLLSMSFNSEQEKKAGIIVSSSYERELFLIFWSSFLEACKYNSLF